MSEPNTKSIRAIERRYAELQSQFVIEQGPPGLAGAVTFSSNQQIPIHRWFTFKEAFGANIFDFLSIDGDSIRGGDRIFMDPFCGSGTTILACDLQKGWVCHRIGVETNPFIAFVARTKADWRKYDPAIVEKHIRNILAAPLQEDIPDDEWPSLSTFKDTEMFDKKRVSALIDAVHRSNNLPEPYDALFLLGVASIVERVGLYRKTGRALRKLNSIKGLEERRSRETESEIRRVWTSFAYDIKQAKQLCNHESAEFAIIRADSRTLDHPCIRAIEPNSVSLMIYSPPYLNQIDYTEVYKVESWLLGFIDSSEEMRNQRVATVRSHSSIKLPESNPRLTNNAKEALQLVNTIVSSNDDPWHQMFPRTACGYFSDMQQSLKKQFELLEPGAQVRCVIGNSAHGAKGRRIAVATDLLLADIAKDIGFEIPKIQIARMLARKDHLNSYLRESVVWMRKPDTQ